MSSPATTPPPVFDRASLLERLDGDTDLLLVIARVFLEDAPRTMHGIDTACAAQDAAALRLSAHALKGASANISAEALRAAADDLEQIAAGGRLPDAPAGAARVRRELEALTPVLEGALGQRSTPC